MGEMGLKQAIEEYKEIYLAYRNFAQRTRVEYLNDLEDLARYLDGIGVRTTGELQLPHLVRYIAELEKRGFAGSTRKRKVISIRSFTGFLHMEGYILSDVGKRLIPPFVVVRKPRYLTQNECDRLLESAKGNIRDYAIIQLFLHTGIKLSELVRLTINDLQISVQADKNGYKIEYIRVVGKDGKGRVIPLHSAARKGIRSYLASKEKSETNYLFLNRSGNPIGGRGVEKVIQKYFSDANIQNATVNSLRHTFSKNLANKVTDKKVVKNILGCSYNRTIETNISVGY